MSFSLPCEPYRAPEAAARALEAVLIMHADADRHHVAFGGSGIELAWAKEPRFGVRDHLVPLGDPADGARHGEIGKNIAGGSPKARKMELAFDEILVFERDPLQLHRKIEQPVVTLAERVIPCPTDLIP